MSPKKQDKALINAARATNIRFVLSNKKTTAVESAQFRYDVCNRSETMLTKQILGKEDVSATADRRMCARGKAFIYLDGTC